MRKGACLRCGQCCKAGAFWEETTDEEKALALRWTKGKILEMVEQNQDCPYLRRDGATATCLLYSAKNKKPWYCETYPEEGRKLLPGCGYYFE